MSYFIRSTLAVSAVAACAIALFSHQASAANRDEIATGVGKAISELYSHTPSAKSLAGKAEAMLVFPSVYKAGIGVGGSYGEGALVKGGNTIVDFYNIAAASAGLQLGAQKQSVVLMFMTPESLAAFRSSDGWKAGVDANVALIEVGAAKSIDTKTLQQPIIGFIYSESGLMAGLTLEGSKITKIKK